MSTIKSVDFRIKATGKGIVNWNGSSDGILENGNTMMPKARGIDLSQREVTSKEGKEYSFNRSVEEISKNLKGKTVYISQNCIRSAIFESDAYALVGLSTEHAPLLIPSIIGLVRGYALTTDGKQPLMRKSPLYVSDFDSEATDLIFEILTVKGGREDKTGGLFGKITAGDLNYNAVASISIEEMQFIPLDGIFGRAAGDAVTPEQGEDLAKKVSEYLSALATDLGLEVSPVTRFGCYKRKGSVALGAEWGILLDDASIDVLVLEIHRRLSSLTIRRTKGFVQVDSCEADYNVGHTLRVATNVGLTTSRGETPFHCYYDAASEQDQRERDIVMQGRSEASKPSKTKDSPKKKKA